ncbi:casein kinase-related [Holotrichia oblita]|uniref:Casein kinase-related n=1 Tax=Holotrichia oblita TaxID=644536 RepID=A0ACB9TX11_HOLOL|nr:casein kinase-related [Holotrichia oblita]
MPKAIKAAPKKKQNGYKMPDPLPPGEILKDMVGKKWKLGSSIGKGGFGEIYAAQEYSEGSTKIDFGLAVHYTTSDKFKPDPKKAHDGTIEYLSIDAHHGVPTRRGDLEILIYNLIQWLGCILPWEKDIKDPLAVKASKEKYMADIPLFMKTCFGSEVPPGLFMLTIDYGIFVLHFFISDAIINLLKYHKTLEFNSEINYNKVKNILEKGLQSTGGSLSSPLVFKVSKSPAKRKHNQETPLSGKKKKISRRKLVDSCTDDADDKENAKTDSESDLISEPPSLKSKAKNETPKRRGRKPQVKKQNPPEVEHVADEEDVDSDRTDGDTAEMRRIRKKLETAKQEKRSKKTRAKKHNLANKSIDGNPSTSTTPVRHRRNRRKINYKENMESKNNSSDEDVPNSEEED